jgi:hypothetical protein
MQTVPSATGAFWFFLNELQPAPQIGRSAIRLTAHSILLQSTAWREMPNPRNNPAHAGYIGA